MASALLTPSNGAVTLPGGSASDVATMDISESQATESVAAYGAAVYDPYRASGTPHASVACTGFARAHASSTQPFGALGALAGTLGASGATATLTLDTGVTYASTMVIGNVRLAHARLRAAVPLSWQMEGAGDPTITWPTT